VVRVADRFGDYGLVGVLIYETDVDRYKVDTLLLSCRVLGRGVEHALISWLGQRAVKEGIRAVEFTYVPTERNLPALEFMASIGDQYRTAGKTSWTFPAERLARVTYDPDEKVPLGQEELEASKSETPASEAAAAFGDSNLSERLEQIGRDLCDIERLTNAIQAYRTREEPLDAADDAALGGTLEVTLLNIWRRVLGRPRIGVNDNFFEVGGTSLRAVQVIAMMKNELKLTVSIVTLFECPTVALLAAKLGATPEDAESKSASAALLRGRRRRDGGRMRRDAQDRL